MKVAMQEPVSVRSFRRFISETLPAALAKVVPLADYRAEEVAPGVGRVRLTVSAPDGPVTVSYDDLPFPRADGTFFEDGKKIVVMTASSNDLEHAEIKAVGEQLADEILPRLAPPPADLALTEETLRSWLPLDRWLSAFLNDSPTSIWRDYYPLAVHPLAPAAELRRIIIEGDDVSFHWTQLGRACLLETPEGPNSGRPLHLAVGADVQDGRIVPMDDSPEALLGLSASMIPLLHHDDPARLVMATSMMRQWLPIAGDPEPALVQSGSEPDDPAFWCGRNFLTAYVHWKGVNYEDAIVMSESAARRLACVVEPGSSEPLEVGDKLSNRHGAKGVVGAILPDDDMPHLPDGRAVELIFDAMGVYSRLNFGQVIEAALGNVAHATGKPVVAPPFGGPDAGGLREMLRSAGLPESGQWALTDGKDGTPLDQPSTVGYVYWGKTPHRSRSKLHSHTFDPPYGQLIGRLEHAALFAAGAPQVALDAWSARSTEREDIPELLDALTKGLLESPPFPSPAFERLRRTLAIAGIEVTLDDDGLHYAFATPKPGDLELAVAMPHPWLESRTLTHLGKAAADRPGYQAVAEANQTLHALQEGAAPVAVREAAEARLRSAVTALFDQLLTREEAWLPVWLQRRALFTGRTVLAPGYDLAPDQLGLPEDIAWPLFGPLAAGRVGASEVEKRSRKARKALMALMEDNVVILNRAPTWEPTCVTAFRPVLCDGFAIRLHPICCRMYNADYDGDQAAVWLPITRAAQEEARQRLTIVGHLERDPAVVIQHLTPSHAAMYGLACLTRDREPRRAMAEDWPDGLPVPDHQIDRAWLANALGQALAELGARRTLEIVTRLAELGFAAATKSGASLSPFAGEGVALPPQPTTEYAASWSAWSSQADAAILTQGPADPTIASAVLAVQSGARGSVSHLRAMAAGRGVMGPHGSEPPIRHSLRDGVTPHEMWQMAAEARGALQRWHETVHIGAMSILRAASSGMITELTGTTVLQQAASDSPGPVFAEAAARGATDLLTDPRVRLFVGLPPLEK